jgi:uncharacterized protein
MKKLLSYLILCFSVSAAWAFTVPQYQGFVNDYAGTLTPEQGQELATQLTTYEKATGNEIALVIVKSLEEDTVENAAEQIFNTWKIGKNKKDNGVLFLIAPQEHKMRIEVGYGLEPDLTDLESRWILDETVKPYFKQSDYYGGIKAGLTKIQEALGSEASVVPAGYTEQSKPKKGRIHWDLILFGAFFGFQWLVSILARSKSWWLGGVLGGLAGILLTIFAGAGFLLLTPVLILAGLLLDYIVSKEYRRSGPTAWWAGGSSWGGSSSGGDSFGGFGGGSSGGGGSSSSW